MHASNTYNRTMLELKYKGDKEKQMDGILIIVQCLN